MSFAKKIGGNSQQIMGGATTEMKFIHPSRLIWTLNLKSNAAAAGNTTKNPRRTVRHFRLITTLVPETKKLMGTTMMIAPKTL